ncbi:MAG TPA: hypothetical protein VMF66_08795 [Candidatus Acidoferrum sp.]|nr:hypothetical protein [Candidatus Acidoferrum sp.]
MLQELGTLLASAGSELAKKSVGWASDKFKEFTETARGLEQHKRRIKSARVTSTIYAELHAFRNFFLEHGLAEKNQENQRFFHKWLSDPVIERGWTPSGGWTAARVADLHQHLEKVKV